MNQFYCQIFDAGKPYFPEEPDLEQMIRSGSMIKNSPTTCAAIVTLPNGKKVFIKRNNKKGFRFMFRYIFRKARVFRAADAALQMERIGIPTPQVYLAAESRRNGFLQAGYLVTDTIPDICAVSTQLLQADEPGDILPGFLEKAAEYCAILHRNDLEHGDLKLINFYWDGEKYGIWDLDSVRYWKKGIPHERIDEELSRIISSLYRINLSRLPEQWNDHAALAKHLADLYQKYAPDLYQPSPQAILAFAEQRLRRNRP